MDFRNIFENDYPGFESIRKDLIKPVFGDKVKETQKQIDDIKELDKNIISSITVFAVVSGMFPINFVDVTIKDNVRLEHNRVSVQRCIRRIMEGDSSAITFFHYENTKDTTWRITFVNKGENTGDITNPKRYTYLCGVTHACHTATQRFSILQSDISSGKKKLDELMLNAFSVESVSKDFFDKYRELYADLVEYISGKRFIKKGGKFVEEKTKNANTAFKSAFDGDDKAVRDYVKKMMGRLVFLHFLQKKGWLGVEQGEPWGTGDQNFIYNLFRNAKEEVKKDFLELVLEPLFFRTLNEDRGEEAIAPKLVCDTYGKKIRIPYLNGGLFEEDELDKKKVKFKKEHFESLLEFFNQYNFTIDETDPDDTEIGVDPEMLGKIFENLLEDNKDKGAFYTPKEIVQYMCRESLIAYIVNETNLAEEKIRSFVTEHNCTLEQKEKADVLKALLDVKICDPAVGSGAFPMGMLNELLGCMLLLTENTKSRAELKKHIVKNNIYGVDIEKGAVDIARLRFWLAIIVDEENPLPLPNLDYKIMQGNSLLESFEGEDLSNLTSGNPGGLFDIEKEIKALTTTLSYYFDTQNHEERDAHREAIRAAVYELLKAKNYGNETERIKKLKNIDLHENDKFFLWHTWFADVFNRTIENTRNGFDIVIGNPPYIRRTSIAEGSKRYYEKLYKSATKQYDMYLLFIEKGLLILKTSGHLCFINPIRFFNSDYGLGCRRVIIEANKLKSVLDVSQLPVFQNAMTYPCVLIIQHGNDKNCNNSIMYKRLSDLSSLKEIDTINGLEIDQKEILSDPEYKIIVDANPKLKSIIKKIDNNSDKIENQFIIARGLANNKVNFDGSKYKALKSTNVRRYFIEGSLKTIDTDYAAVFSTEMIIMPRTVAFLQAMLKEKEIICLDRIYYLTPKITCNLKFILGILNSKLTNLWFEYYYNTTKVSGNYFDLNGLQIGSIPIPVATSEDQEEIANLVDKILSDKSKNNTYDTSETERELDKLLYKLYGLTSEEISIVENMN